MHEQVEITPSIGRKGRDRKVKPIQVDRGMEKLILAFADAGVVTNSSCIDIRPDRKPAEACVLGRDVDVEAWNRLMDKSRTLRQAIDQGWPPPPEAEVSGTWDPHRHDFMLRFPSDWVDWMTKEVSR